MKRGTTDLEQFAFSDTLKDVEWKPRGTEEETRRELFGENFDPEKVIDKYEETVGIKSPNEKKFNVLYKSVMLSPGDDEDDRQLLFDLMNDKELYPHLKEESNWTPRGEYKMFIIYAEDQDVKKKRQAEAALKQSMEAVPNE